MEIPAQMASVFDKVRAWRVERELARARRLRDGELLDEARAAYRAAMERARALGEDHERFSTPLDELSRMLIRHGFHDEAGPLVEMRVAIAERALGAGHPDLAEHLSGFALQYRAARQFKRAEPLQRRAQAILDAAFPSDHARVQGGLDALAGIVLRVGHHAEAEALYQRLHDLEAATLAPDDLGLASSLNRLAYVKRLLGKDDEALAVEERVARLRDHAKGREPS